MNDFEYEVDCIIESYISEFGDYEPIHEIGDTWDNATTNRVAYALQNRAEQHDNRRNYYYTKRDQLQHIDKNKSREFWNKGLWHDRRAKYSRHVADTLKA